ncbi:hypothetical protein Q5M85_20575 [Paraclostridium bifermentans]|nr:hypothetical protein [Paraclostridium bifermentans]
MVNTKIDNEEHYMKALRYYYDCIMGPFKPYVLKAIEKIKNLKVGYYMSRTWTCIS